MAHRKLWAILLGIWAIASGLLSLTNVTFQFAPVILALVLLAAGVCLFIDR